MKPFDIDKTQKLKRMPVEERSIPTVCSWCGKRFQIKKWKVEEGKATRITHGICPECAEKLQDETDW